MAGPFTNWLKNSRHVLDHPSPFPGQDHKPCATTPLACELQMDPLLPTAGGDQSSSVVSRRTQAKNPVTPQDCHECGVHSQLCSLIQGNPSATVSRQRFSNAHGPRSCVCQAPNAFICVSSVFIKHQFHQKTIFIKNHFHQRPISSEHFL